MVAPHINIPEPSAPLYRGFHSLRLHNRSYASHYIPIRIIAFGRDQNLFLCFYFQGFLIANLQHCIYNIYKLQAAAVDFVQSGLLTIYLILYWASWFLLFDKSNSINSRPPNNDETWCSHTGNCISLLVWSKIWK